jgi:hypothetical protein
MRFNTEVGGHASSTHITEKAGYTKIAAHAGAVAFIQRFGSALNLNVHLHMLFLDGVYVDNEHESAARSKMTPLAMNSRFGRLLHTAGSTGQLACISLLT